MLPNLNLSQIKNLSCKNKWTYSSSCSIIEIKLNKPFSINSCLSFILSKLNIDSKKELNQFLQPSVLFLENPLVIHNIGRAANRVIDAIFNKSSVLIVGDYDVDGITSTTLLIKLIHYYGSSQLLYLIPDRRKESYGLSKYIINRGLSQIYPNLLIALDCGTNSPNEVRKLKTMNIDTLIIDHHLSKDNLPEDCILINPHVYKSTISALGLCSAGLTFKFIQVLVGQLNLIYDMIQFDLDNYLYLVALGSIADIIPFLLDNRIFVSCGLKSIVNSNHYGIKSLIFFSGLFSNQNFVVSDVSFGIGPRLNAGGRISDAIFPLEMLLNENSSKCHSIANYINQINQKRQIMGEKMLSEAKMKISNLNIIENSVIVLYSDSWHIGIVGITAGAIVHEYKCPAIILGKYGKYIKGSGRSSYGTNLIETLRNCNKLIHSWGGHSMAIGITILVKNFIKFKKKIHEVLLKQGIDSNSSKIKTELIDWLSLSFINKDFLNGLQKIEPYGRDNPEPVFGLKSLSIEHNLVIFGKKHFRFKFCVNGNILFGVAWKKSHKIPPLRTSLDVLIKLKNSDRDYENFFYIELIDWRLVRSGGVKF